MSIDLNSQGDTNIGGDVVGRDKITTIVQPPVTGVSALHQLPPPPDDFTGREAELKELLDAMRFETGAAISGLRGLGGVGKTALALKLAERVQSRYPDAQFFVELRGASDAPLSPAEALARVVRAYHPTAKLPEAEAELRALYLSVLHGQRALVLLDDARDAAQVKPLLPPSNCGVIVTSRQKFTLPGLRAKDLDILPPDDARTLLLRIAERIGEQAQVIANLCGYLPLALRLAGSALAERVDLSPADYLRRLGDAQQRLRLTGADASLGLSYDLLAPEQQNHWRALAVFPATYDRAAAAAVWELEPDPAQDMLSELVRYSLVDFTSTPALPRAKERGAGEGAPPPSPVGDVSDGGGDGGGGRYRLHDLARLFADARLSDSERGEGGQRHAAHYKNVLAAADDLYLEGGDSLMRALALLDLEWPNIQTGQAWAAAHAESDGAAAQLCAGYPDAGAYCIALRLHPRERIRWLEAALRAARRRKDRAAEGRHLGNLGLAYADLGEPRRAIEFYEQALAIDREIGDRRGEGATLGNLGLAYADLGEARRAIEFYEQQLVIAREIGDRRGEGNALWNMSLALDKLGNRAQAVAYAEAALKIYEQIESPAAEKVRKQLEGWKGVNG